MAEKSMTEQNKEQRRYIRLNTVFPVEIRFVEKHTGKNITGIIQSFTRDVSSGGMCLELSAVTDEILSLIKNENVKLSITLKLPLNKRPINAFANIVWDRTIKDGAFEKLLLGVCYDNIIKADQKKLFRYARAVKRKPYTIAAIILVLLLYGLYASYYYNITSNKAKSLLNNLNLSDQAKKTINSELSVIKEKEKRLKNILTDKEKKISELNEKIEQIAITLKDESKEDLILELTGENEKLEITVKELNEEINFLEKDIKNLESKKLYLSLSDSLDKVHIDQGSKIDIVTLNNNSKLVGTIVEEEGLKVILKLSDGTQVDLYADDIKSINRIDILAEGIGSDLQKISEKVVVEEQIPEKITVKEIKTEKILAKPELQVELLNKIEYDTFLYFLNEINKENGLVRDASDSFSPCSIAAVGFALASYCIAESKGWIEYEEAYDTVHRILKTFYEDIEHKNGFFYHFLGMNSGRRVWNSELSSIDTTLFICGALVAGEYFANTDISKLAKKLYDRIDWKWMTNKKSLLSLGWKPETGFLPYFWDSYNEGILAYVLATGSDTYPLDPAYWGAWKRLVGRYIGSKEYEFIYCTTGSLFVYQYPHLWLDLRHIDDNGLNYWENSMLATYSNRQFCLDNKDKYKTYEQGFWGLSASLGPNGYKGYGAEPGIVIHDGTVAPYAVISALPYAPEIAVPTIKKMYDLYGDKLYGFYGFKDAFNLDKDWYAKKYIGIDQGASILAIENYLSGFIWKYFMKTTPVKNWLKRCIREEDRS